MRVVNPIPEGGTKDGAQPVPDPLAHLVGELAELVTGSVPGRMDPTQITLFKSLGLALEDLAAAQRVFDAAVAQGRGVRVEIGAPH